MTDRTIEQKIQDARPFAYLQDSTEYQQACALAERYITRQWKTSATTEERESAYFTLQGLNLFKMMVQGMVDEGKLAQKKLERREDNGS